MQYETHSETKNNYSAECGFFVPYYNFTKYASRIYPISFLEAEYVACDSFAASCSVRFLQWLFCWAKKNILDGSMDCFMCGKVRDLGVFFWGKLIFYMLDRLRKQRII